MAAIICSIGYVVTFLLVLLGLLYILYRVVPIKKEARLSVEDMPVLRPVPIPTSTQRTVIQKLLVLVFEIRKWKLGENWHYRLKENVEVVIPKEFDFDGASIPRPFWALLSPVGVLLIPGLLHDYAYQFDQLWEIGSDGCPRAYQKGAGKEYWDELFRETAEEVNGFSVINAIAWLAVSIGGSGAWRRHRNANLQPQEPVLEGCGRQEA